MFKNQAGQSVTLYIYDANTGLPKAGDAANIIVYVQKDDGAVAAVTSNGGVPAEVDSTNAKGVYKIALTQSETNADKLIFTGKSSTSNVVVAAKELYTTTDPLTNQTGGHASGTGYAALDKIGTGRITTQSPVSQSGDITVYVGDDYSSDDARAIDQTDASNSWPDLAGASVSLTIKGVSRSFSLSIPVPSGVGKKVRWQPTAADTGRIPLGSRTFAVEASLSNGHTVRLLSGTLIALS